MRQLSRTPLRFRPLEAHALARAHAPARGGGASVAWRVAPALVAAMVAAAYLIGEVRTSDLAAAEFRAELFGREGFTVWNGHWYGGHHTPAYSVLFPPLAWLVGPSVAGALAAVAAAALFEPLARGRWGDRARWGSLWFGLAAGATLFVGRLPFLLGVAIGLGALLALQRGRHVAAVALGLACPLASPVAGLFVALAGTAHAMAHRREPSGRAGALVAVAAVAPTLILAAAFPEGGEQPFPGNQFAAVALFAVACLAALPRAETTLRIGAALYGAGATAAFVLATPVGNNAARLGILFGGPVLLCALAGRVRGPLRVAAAAALLAALAWWQLAPSVRHAVRVQGADPAGDAAYYRPLASFLEAAGPATGRVEIPLTATRRETAEVAARLPLARGWERQLDVERNRLFYEGELGAPRYERWLRENGVHWVALPDAAPDYSARDEAALIRGGLPFLRERWRDAHWRVFEVVPRPRVAGPGLTVVRLGTEGAVLRATGSASAVVRVRWSPYWAVKGGCVERAGDWTRVLVRRAGVFELEPRFSPERLISRGRRCAA